MEEELGSMLRGRKAESLLDIIMYSCSMGESINGIMEEVNRLEVVFSGSDQANEFFQLVTELSNNTRL